MEKVFMGRIRSSRKAKIFHSDVEKGDILIDGVIAREIGSLMQTEAK